MFRKFAILAGALCLSTPVLAQEADDHGISGVWFVQNPDQPLRPANGDALKLTAAGKARMAQNAAWTKAPPPPTKTDLTACLPQPAPHLLTMRFPFRIAEKKMPGAGAVSDFVLFVFEHNHTFRFVYMNEAHKEAGDVLPSYAGNSVGRWDNGDLVVEDRHFIVGPSTMLDVTGLPMSEKLRVTERYKKRSDGGLDVTLTIDDSDMYDNVWEAKRTLIRKPGEDIVEYACGVGDLSTRETRSAP
jgi:hypothetical protein